MSYKVKLDIFEGPFDLLVYLIERSGVSIYDVNISEITDQFIEYVAIIEQIDSETAAEFMVLAATLIQIKSRMLLPVAEKEKDSVETEDPRDELARKLNEYKKYRYLAQRLAEAAFDAEKIFTKPREDISLYTQEPKEYLIVDMNKFIKAFRGFLEKRKTIEDVKKRYQRVARERMTMEAKAEYMDMMLHRRRKVRFTELLEGQGGTYDVVLTFVTLLEMLKTNMITAVQTGLFDEIEIILNEEALGDAG